MSWCGGSGPHRWRPWSGSRGCPGSSAQHDFGQVDVRYHDGLVERVHFFASRLKWSRVVHVVLVPDEREETLIRALLAALEAFGGVPLVTVWDNPKTVVLCPSPKPRPAAKWLICRL